jgi:hypothetical protein
MRPAMIAAQPASATTADATYPTVSRRQSHTVSTSAISSAMSFALALL